jgi:hypothetical protein
LILSCANFATSNASTEKALGAALGAALEMPGGAGAEPIEMGALGSGCSLMIRRIASHRAALSDFAAISSVIASATASLSLPCATARSIYSSNCASSVRAAEAPPDSAARSLDASSGATSAAVGARVEVASSAAVSSSRAPCTAS